MGKRLFFYCFLCCENLSKYISSIGKQSSSKSCHPEDAQKSFHLIWSGKHISTVESSLAPFSDWYTISHATTFLVIFPKAFSCSHWTVTAYTSDFHFNLINTLSPELRWEILSIGLFLGKVLRTALKIFSAFAFRAFCISMVLCRPCDFASIFARRLSSFIRSVSICI